MPRYFFNVHLRALADDADDIEGEELADDEAAWHEATLMLGDLAKDIDGKFRPGQSWSLEVTDEDQRRLYFIHVSSEKR